MFVFFLLLNLSAGVEKVRAQISPNFDFSLGIDYTAAEQTLDYFDRQVGDTKRIAELRGNQLAAATSVTLARTEKSEADFCDQLELARNISRFESDVYGFSIAKNHIPELRKLLNEVKRRQFDRRIVATIASFFPEQAKISTRFSVYLVVIGNERTSAFMRHVVWNYNVPTFVDEDKGEPVIVVNLARALEGTPKSEDQFIGVLSTTAHECFHAAFSIMQKNLPNLIKPKNIAEQLLTIVQNEGIAYYLSMQTYLGGQTPSRVWFNGTINAIETLNQVLLELHSPHLTQSRARELMMNANLSGSFEGNYGATAGTRMAYEIDNQLGRPALTSTMLGGGRMFISMYLQACRRDGALPQIDRQLLRLLHIE
jgi:hypothetical protein